MEKVDMFQQCYDRNFYYIIQNEENAFCVLNTEKFYCSQRGDSAWCNAYCLSENQIKDLLSNVDYEFYSSEKRPGSRE